jgi:hypothetical protein
LILIVTLADYQRDVVRLRDRVRILSGRLER